MTDQEIAAAAELLLRAAPYSSSVELVEAGRVLARHLAADRAQIRQLRGAIQDVLCDPGNGWLGKSTVAKLQALRGDAMLGVERKGGE